MSEERKLISIPILILLGIASISEEPGWDHSSLTPEQSACVKYDISARGKQKTTQAATAAFFPLALFILSTKASLGFSDVTTKHITENPALPGAVKYQ